MFFYLAHLRLNVAIPRPLNCNNISKSQYLLRFRRKSILDFPNTFGFCYSTNGDSIPFPNEDLVSQPAAKRSKITLLIDGSPLIFRSYYAIPTKPGLRPLNAVFGFLQSVLKIIRENPCDYLAVCLEGKSNFRRVLDSNYKANRLKVDDNLLEQFPIIDEALDAMGIKIGRMDYYEADDVICSLANQAQNSNYSVLIVSPDKDLWQVLGPNVRVLSKSELITYSSFIYNKKIKPHQWPDYQAMVGDATDNVRRILSPTAAMRLLGTFDSLDNIIKNMDNIPRSEDRIKIKENVIALERNLRLVSLNTQLPVDLEQFEFSNISFKNTKSFLAKYSLKSILRIVENMETNSALQSNKIDNSKVKKSRKIKIAPSLDENVVVNSKFDLSGERFNFSLDTLDIELPNDTRDGTELRINGKYKNLKDKELNNTSIEFDKVDTTAIANHEGQKFQVEFSTGSSDENLKEGPTGIDHIEIISEMELNSNKFMMEERFEMNVDEENDESGFKWSKSSFVRSSLGSGAKERKKKKDRKNKAIEHENVENVLECDEIPLELVDFDTRSKTSTKKGNINEGWIEHAKFPLSSSLKGYSTINSIGSSGSVDPDPNHNEKKSQIQNYALSFPPLEEKYDNVCDDANARKANEDEEDDNSESNLSLVNFIKNRKSVEIDLEFVNLFNLCKTTRDVRVLIESKIPGVNVVNDLESAERIFDKLLNIEESYHACDTETINLDLKKQSPINNAKVICVTIYCGPGYDFGNGPCIWIDSLENEEVLIKFKDYFESPKIRKIWHNYGFDRHVIYNSGIDCKGFGGDTMHMARLWDASRKGSKAYSLEVLSSNLLEPGLKTKVSMKKRFGQIKLKKDGTQSKSAVVLPKLNSLQKSAESILEWIDYSTLDAKNTWEIREVLEGKLVDMPWKDDKSMWDFYIEYWLPFGELLTEIERSGIKIDQEYLSSLIPLAESDIQHNEEIFIKWAQKYVCEDCKYMNPRSDAQKQQLFFAPCVNALDPNKTIPKSRVFQTENLEDFIEEGKKKPKKKRDFVIDGLGLPFIEATQSGWPAVSNNVLSKLSGEPPVRYGVLLDMFKERGMEGGKEGCEALAAVIESNKVQTLLNTFIVPLATYADRDGRIHCSLNINTETGRLSSRRPNLQNQPAHEKDKFKIRRAFTSEKGRMLIVADYGQLELRLLAHITKCKSMIDAFHCGGDFHSRTAMSMYSSIEKAISEGRVLLEWDGSRGSAPLPLLKDVFKMERRKAKTLNFSIAYGKTTHGLAKDWNVSLAEARDTLDRWYSNRPEVLQWQQDTIREAHETGYTKTLLGRYRPLPDINSNDRMRRAHMERAAINTPLQGGAADIVTAAMVKLYRNERIKKLDWHQILQIHDEIILEGPQESVEEVMEIVRSNMTNSIDTPLLVELLVDVKSGKTWDEAK